MFEASFRYGVVDPPDMALGVESQREMGSSPFILLSWNVTVSRDLANVYPLSSVLAFRYHFERKAPAQ